jgi:hypothetical protein
LNNLGHAVVPSGWQTDRGVNLSLVRVVRTVIRADTDPARQALFANLVQSHRFVRLIYRAHRAIQGTWPAAVLVSSYGVAAFFGIAPARNRAARVLALAKHANARRQVQRVGSWLDPADIAFIRTGAAAFLHPSGLPALASLWCRPRPFQWLRLIRAVDRRYGFLVSCRVAGAVSWYARAKRVLDASRPGAVLVSSDSQPEEMAFVAAAAAAGIPSVFVSHAYPTPLSPPLQFDLSILEGTAELAARRQKGPVRGRVILAGIGGESAPMNPSGLALRHPVIGIFAPKAVAWDALAALIEDCQRLHARQVIVRWHPSMLERPHLRRSLRGAFTNVVESPRDADIADVAKQCNWVIVDENSHAHLPVLRLGIPTIAVRLGVYPASRVDQYGLLAAGVVFPTVPSIADFDRDAVAAFYAGDWADRFARFDASYLRPAETCATEVRLGIFALFAAHSEGAVVAAAAK